ncbi:MAG TPA: hypothetical protein PK231_04760 [Acidocella sp.]|nr:hypothetical protein [Acidocella sp.]
MASRPLSVWDGQNVGKRFLQDIEKLTSREPESIDLILMTAFSAIEDGLKSSEAKSFLRAAARAECAGIREQQQANRHEADRWRSGR